MIFRRRSRTGGGEGAAGMEARRSVGEGRVQEGSLVEHSRSRQARGERRGLLEDRIRVVIP